MDDSHLKPRLYRPKTLIPLEYEEQIEAVRWLDRKMILSYHIPNGGKRHVIEAAKFKRMGLRAGVPDICIPIPISSYHGLYIEVKRRSGGNLSDQQQWWLEVLSQQGYDTYVAKGCDDFIEYVTSYLQGEK